MGGSSSCCSATREKREFFSALFLSKFSFSVFRLVWLADKESSQREGGREEWKR